MHGETVKFILKQVSHANILPKLDDARK